MENIKEKLQNFIENFKDLPREKKVVLGSIIAAGLILIIGTVMIILTTVFNVERNNEDESLKKLNSEIESQIDTLDDNLNEYSLDRINEKIERIDANFEIYEEQLGEIDSKLNEFELPVSSPVN